MICTHCGAENSDQAMFCAKCGKQVQTTSLQQPSSLTPSSTATAEVAIHTHPIETWRTAISSSAKWIRRVAIPLATLAWIGLVAVILWAASHIGRSLILLAIATLLAVALAPAVKLATRVMPRILAILVVYLVVFTVLGLVFYFLIRTAVLQVSELKGEVTQLLHPVAGRPPTPLEVTLQSFGIEQAQIQEARLIIVNHLANLANDVVPLVRSIFDFVLDFIVVAMLSVYFLIDGARIMHWLRGNMPLQQRTLSLLDILERVVGGYIRGQFTLSFLIGLLVGLGMAILQVPHPILLGELAFFMAFVPVLGTFITAAACVLLALTQNQGWAISLTHQSWVLAIIVLVYFLAVHAFESHIVGPRIVGHAVGLHPIIAISALIAGVELFGFLGALFVAPVVGVLQAVIISLWKEWRVTHPEFFAAKKAMAEGDLSREATSPPGEMESQAIGEQIE
jgi:predicted PurR-regulated permease PerM